VVDPVNVIANSYVYTGLYSSSFYSFQVTAVYHSTAVSSNTVSIETRESVIIFLLLCLLFYLFHNYSYMHLPAP